MAYTAINFKNKLATFSEHWTPRVIAELNDDQFKLAKVQGDFPWHRHLETDEAFIVLDGEMDLEFRVFGFRIRTTSNQRRRKR